MTDENTPKTSTTRALAAASALPVLVSFLPPQYSHAVMIVCVVMASVGLAATQIDIPKDDKTYKRYFYRVLSLLASNWGKAINAAILLRGKK